MLELLMCWAFAATADVAVPSLSGRVVDQTGTLSAGDIAALTQALNAQGIQAGMHYKPNHLLAKFGGALIKALPAQLQPLFAPSSDAGVGPVRGEVRHRLRGIASATACL
jgi:hypothetical protein